VVVLVRVDVIVELCVFDGVNEFEAEPLAEGVVEEDARADPLLDAEPLQEEEVEAEKELRPESDAVPEAAAEILG
jgi:hypothetical protein